MTVNENNLYQYFTNKFRDWKNMDGSIERHVPTPGGKEKVIAELQQDADYLKASVCPYLKEAGYDQSKSVLIKATEGALGFLTNFPVTGTIDVTLGALIYVCGYKRKGLQLIVDAL